MNGFKNTVLSSGLALMLTACANVGTDPGQITGTYVSPLKYQDYSCSQLSIETSSLSRRLSALNTAQASRVSSNEVQAFWLGYGNGDGIEAAELANVKGELEAVRYSMESKNCR